MANISNFSVNCNSSLCCCCCCCCCCSVLLLLLLLAVPVVFCCCSVIIWQFVVVTVVAPYVHVLCGCYNHLARLSNSGCDTIEREVGRAFCQSGNKGDIGGYPMRQYGKKNWQKYRNTTIKNICFLLRKHNES